MVTVIFNTKLKQNPFSSFGDAPQHGLSSQLLCKNVTTNMYKTIVIPIVYMGVKLGALYYEKRH
jgi:hypothetical protein